MCESAGSSNEWDELIDGLIGGNQEVITRFYQQHGATLRAIANRQIGTEMQRRVAPSEVVQSAFRTFFRKAGEGQFQFEDSEKLWSLLCAITLTKVREKVRYHRREKRDVRRELAPQPSEQNRGGGIDLFAGDSLAPDVAIEFAEQFQYLMDALDEEEQQILSLKIDDSTNEEIAEAVGISERTVRRIVKRLQGQLQKMFGPTL